MQTQNLKLFVSFVLVLTAIGINIVNAQVSKDEFIVVLDAGHGGHDPGKHAKSGLKEKDIALKIVLGIGEILEKNKNIKVVYTRKTDVFVDLVKRGKIANNANADLFVSVHCNAHNSQAYGSETYVLGIHRNKTNFEVAKAENEVIFLEENYEENYAGFDPNTPESFIGLSFMQEEYLDQSIKLATIIQDNFTNQLKRKNRGVKQAGFIVLHQTVMPSVLIETGFVTNTNEGQYLNSNKGQLELSTAIANAIMDYKTDVDLNVGNHIEKPIADTSPINKNSITNIVFKVQLAASRRALDPKPYNFNGLNEVSREKTDNLYRYYYGNTTDYHQVQQLQIQAQNKGYKTAFITAFKDGKRVKVSEALKTLAK